MGTATRYDKISADSTVNVDDINNRIESLYDLLLLDNSPTSNNPSIISISKPTTVGEKATFKITDFTNYQSPINGLTFDTTSNDATFSHNLTENGDFTGNGNFIIQATNTEENIIYLQFNKDNKNIIINQLAQLIITSNMYGTESPETISTPVSGQLYFKLVEETTTQNDNSN